MALHASLALTAPNAAPLGAERIALLEAIGREGGISAAARALGMSYRGAWDAVRAMNNLVGRPLVAGQSGGPGGGGARLTPEGARLVESFRRLEAEMARAFGALAPDLAGDAAAARLMFGGFLRTSARNALRGVVEETAEGEVSAEVALRIAEDALIRAKLTSRSLRELGLFPGRAAVALVKAPMITLVPAASAGTIVGGNRIAGIVADVARDAASTEVNLDIGAGRTLCAILPGGLDTAPPFAPGEPALALIDPANVILAVE